LLSDPAGVFGVYSIMCKQTQGFRQKICVQLGIADNGLPEKVKGRRTLFGVLMMATRLRAAILHACPFILVLDFWYR